MENEKKTEAELLAEKLLLDRKNMGLTADDATEQAAQDFCEPYKAFLNACKTEREAVTYIVGMAEKQGYKPFEPGKAYQPGEKIYYNNRGKALILCTMIMAALKNTSGLLSLWPFTASSSRKTVKL